MVKTTLVTTIDSDDKQWALNQGFKLNFVFNKGIEYLRKNEYYKNLEAQIKVREDNILKMQDVVGKAYSMKEKLEDEIKRLKRICIENNISYRDEFETL